MYPWGRRLVKREGMPRLPSPPGTFDSNLEDCNMDRMDVVIYLTAALELAGLAWLHHFLFIGGL